MEKNTNRISTIALHLLTWALFGYVILFQSPMMDMRNIPVELWLQQIGRLLLLAIVFYSNMQFVFDWTFRRKKYWQFALWIISAVIVLNFISIFLTKALGIREIMTQNGKPFPPEDHLVDGFMVITTLMVLGISTSMAAIKHSQYDQRRREESEQQRVISELAQLKSQINPHFFFNTLNNIYALSYTDVPEARQTIHKLSRMMRYIIYETQPDKVPLKKELDFVDDYLSLMRLRLTENIVLDYQSDKHLEEEIIAPMVLLPFIENAFKHGISSLQHSIISIQIKIEQSHQLVLLVENDIRSQGNTLQKEIGGIGLDNTMRRLELLYPNKYTLQIDNNNGKYLVRLNINLV